MKFLPLFCSVSLATLFSACGQHQWQSSNDTAVFGEDSRKAIKYEDSPLHKRLVKIQTSVTQKRRTGHSSRTIWGNCSGLLIGPDLVLTSAHCLAKAYNLDGKRRKKEVDIDVFSEFYSNNVYRDHAKAKKIVKGNYKVDGGPERWSEDWAILQVDKKLGDTNGYFKMNHSPADAQYVHRQEGLLMLAFHSGLSGPHITPACSLLRAYTPGDSRVWTHDCDMTKGSSGASILKCPAGPLSEGCEVIGINIFEETDNKETEAVEVPDENGTRLVYDLDEAFHKLSKPAK